MDSFRSHARFYLAFSGVVLSALVHGVQFYAFGFFFPRYVYRLAQVWMQMWVDIYGARIFTSGLTRPKWDEPCVLVSNHLSYMDIPALFLTAPIHIHFIAMKELAKVPIIGHSMKVMQMVFIDRKRGGKAAYDALDEAAEKIRKGRQLLSFPEGGISRDGGIGPFKKGLFRLAVKAKVPIVPILIRGTGDVMDCIRKKSRAGNVEVEFLDPVSTSGYSEENIQYLVDKVRSLMVARYGDGSLTGEGVEFYKAPSR